MQVANVSIESNEVELQEFHNGKRMELGCLSAVSDNRTAWIARYDVNDWSKVSMEITKSGNTNNSKDGQQDSNGITHS
jgi:hypothetical protein